MIDLGRIYRFRGTTQRNLFCIPLVVDKSRRSVIAVLATDAVTENCSRIQISEKLFLYPAIQGTFSLNSLVKTNSSTLPKIEDLTAALAVSKLWPALNEEEKLAEAESAEVSLSLGQSHQDFDNYFLECLAEFSSFCNSFFLSLEFGVQWYEDYLVQILRGEKVDYAHSFTKASIAALYSGKNLVKVLRQELNGDRDELARYSIRRAADLKASRPASATRGDPIFGPYLEVMSKIGIFELQLLSKGALPKPPKVGPYQISVVQDY